MTKVASFGPELLAALIQGSKDKKVVELPYKDAVVLRARLHSLRAAMRKEKHELAEIVAMAKITISWGPEVSTSTSRKNVKYPSDNHSLVDLIIQPQDSTFRNALEKAGINILADKTPTLIGPEPEDPDTILEQFVKDKQK